MVGGPSRESMAGVEPPRNNRTAGACPSVLALDEPTIALDGHGLATLDRVVRGAAGEGTAVVLVTHDLDYAHSIAHRLLHLDSGSVQRT